MSVEGLREIFQKCQTYPSREVIGKLEASSFFSSAAFGLNIKNPKGVAMRAVLAVYSVGI